MRSKAYIILVYISMLIFEAESHGVISSTTSLQKLLQKERYVIQQLEEALEKTSNGQSTWAREPIQTYLKSYYNVFKYGKTEEEVSYHPIDAFHFLKHVTKGFKDLKVGMGNTKVYTVKEKLDVYLIAVMDAFLNYRLGSKYPELDELERTAASIARMRAVYRIPFDNLIQGRLRTSNKTVFQSSTPLTSQDCFIIGVGATKYNLAVEGMLWLAKAEKLSERDGLTYEEDIQKALKAAKLKMGEAYPHDYTKEEEALCRGETIQASLKNANLVCRYLDRGNPYLLIGPMKLEEKSRDPPIMVFHDFVFDSEIKRFKAFAKENLQTSIIQSEKAGETVEKSAAFERTSDTAWLQDSQDFNLTYRLSRRIDVATNLDTGAHTSNHLASQPYQIVNYGVAGLYVTHTDYLEQVETCDWVKTGGDRMVTILLYLDDVELGGATVFPLAGVTIPPERGAAAVWYNVYRSGAQDYDTRHSGCPVLYGSKWISNKWIMMYGQMNRQKCGLGESEKFDLP